MPNKFGGSKYKKSKKENETEINKTRSLNLRRKNIEGSEYGKVIKLLGNMRVLVMILNRDNSMIHKNEFIGRIPGKFRRKKERINLENIVLVDLESLGEKKCNIIYKYDSDEVSQLLIENEIHSGDITEINTENKDLEQTDPKLDDIIFDYKKKTTETVEIDIDINTI